MKWFKFKHKHSGQVCTARQINDNSDYVIMWKDEFGRLDAALYTKRDVHMGMQGWMLIDEYEVE